jgi:ribonuclease D
MASEIVNPYQLMRNSSIIKLIQSEEECNDICTIFMNDKNKILGFDTEFGIKNGSNFTAATIQLSNGKFTCVIQMNKLKNIPNSLKSVLEDATILKVGVACINDAKVIRNTVNIDVRGCIELPYLASIIDNNIELKSYGLARLSSHYLQINLPKNREIRCNNWANDELSGEKVEYAASDAFHGYMIYKKIISLKSNNNNIDEIQNSIVDKKFKSNNKSAMIQNICIDNLTKNNTCDCVIMSYDNQLLCYAKKSKAMSYIKKNMATIVQYNPFTVKLLYDIDITKNNNGCKIISYMNDISWNTRRATGLWYLEKNLATLVQEDPFTIKLLFQTKVEKHNIFIEPINNHNICVSCGGSNKLSNYHIIPKAIKFIDKTNITTHCLVLLCKICYNKVRYAHDIIINKFMHMYKLDKKYDDNLNIYKLEHSCIMMANAIINNGIPGNKKNEYINKLEEIYQTKELDILQISNKLISKPQYIDLINEYIHANPQCIYKHCHILMQHFIDTLKPKHIPNGWHNMFDI